METGDSMESYSNHIIAFKQREMLLMLQARYMEINFGSSFKQIGVINENPIEKCHIHAIFTKIVLSRALDMSYVFVKLFSRNRMNIISQYKNPLFIISHNYLSHLSIHHRVCIREIICSIYVSV